MKILALSGGEHSCGITYLEDGKPIFAFEEERFNRVRSYKDYYNNLFRYPWQSGQNVWYHKDFDWEKIDYVVTYYDAKVSEEIWDGIGLGPFPKEKYIRINHHQAHCNLAYYCSGFEEDTLVVSIDGAGDEDWGRCYLGHNGNLQLINQHSLKTKSLGHYYCMLTELLGFRRIKDEGKIVGLSSHGKYVSWIYEAFNECITLSPSTNDTDLDHPIDTKYNTRKIYEDFHKLFVDKNPLLCDGPHSYKPEDLAYNGQLVFEEKVLQLINFYHKQYPNVKKIALAGGVFANVKLNKKINELKWIDEVFIAPPMGDEGLPLGAALAVHKLKNSDFKPFKLKDIYLGTSFDNIDIKNYNILHSESKYYAFGKFEENSEKYNIRPYNEESLAYDLKEGKVIGWFNGRHEHGPRALCNRSIIADPSVPGTYKKINDRLQRNDNMPFAPVVLDDYANKVFRVKKSKYTAEFMTMLYDTREEWYDRIPAVVHPVDKTARIQIVTKDSNFKFYNLLDCFRKITDIPVLLNTSFNIHGEPIVCRPEEAFVHLDNGIVDKLVINNKTYTKK
tara:strand:+ start:171 stop:1850 length:1680 start_codon:yes stop_codon:yes gene_type:complete